VEEIVIKIAVIAGGILIWLALVYMAEKQARRNRAATSRVAPPERAADN